MMEASTIFLDFLSERVAILAKTCASNAASIGIAVVLELLQHHFIMSDNLLYSTAIASSFKSFVFK
jgi:hypothetical protein